jgi:hypothetical protein
LLYCPAPPNQGERAKALLDQALPLLRKGLGDDHPSTVQCRDALEAVTSGSGTAKGWVVITLVRLVITVIRLVITLIRLVITVIRLVITVMRLVITAIRLVITVIRLVITLIRLVITVIHLVTTIPAPSDAATYWRPWPVGGALVGGWEFYVYNLSIGDSSIILPILFHTIAYTSFANMVEPIGRSRG